GGWFLSWDRLVAKFTFEEPSGARILQYDLLHAGTQWSITPLPKVPIGFYGRVGAGFYQRSLSNSDIDPDAYRDGELRASAVLAVGATAPTNPYIGIEAYRVFIAKQQPADVEALAVTVGYKFGAQKKTKLK